METWIFERKQLASNFFPNRSQTSTEWIQLPYMVCRQERAYQSCFPLDAIIVARRTYK